MLRRHTLAALLLGALLLLDSPAARATRPEWSPQQRSTVRYAFKQKTRALVAAATAIPREKLAALGVGSSFVQRHGGRSWLVTRLSGDVIQIAQHRRVRAMQVHATASDPAASGGIGQMEIHGRYHGERRGLEHLAAQLELEPTTGKLTFGETKGGGVFTPYIHNPPPAAVAGWQGF